MVFLNHESLMYFFKDVCDQIRQGEKVIKKKWFESVVGVNALEDVIRYNYVNNCREPQKYVDS